MDDIDREKREKKKVERWCAAAKRHSSIHHDLYLLQLLFSLQLMTYPLPLWHQEHHYPTAAESSAASLELLESFCHRESSPHSPSLQSSLGDECRRRLF